MELRKIQIVIILSLAVPWTLCNPVNPDGQASKNQQSISSKEVENAEFSLAKVATSDRTLKGKSELKSVSETNLQQITLNQELLISQDPKENANSKQDGIQIGSLVENEEENGALAEESNSTDDQENWIAPLYIRKTFPYVISGFDDYSRPIYIMEVGKMDLRSVVDRGAEAQEAALKYVLQMTNTVKKYLKQLKTEGGKSVTENVVILDFGGLTARQLTTRNLAFLLKLAYKVRDFMEEYVGECYTVNVNFFASQLIQMFRPVFGKTVERFTFLGTNPQKWRPIIRRAFGPQNVPEYYGGNPDWKPVKYYGAR